jgi:hypothetical protein
MGNDNDHIVETAPPERAGATGRSARNVLVFCLVGAILLLIGIAAMTVH